MFPPVSTIEPACHRVSFLRSGNTMDETNFSAEITAEAVQS